jgi:hypothetical protein
MLLRDMPITLRSQKTSQRQKGLSNFLYRVRQINCSSFDYRVIAAG